MQLLESGDGEIRDDVASSGREQTIPAESLDLIDWEKAYLGILDYKKRKNLRNLIVSPGSLRKILEAKDAGGPACVIVANDKTVKPESFRDRKALQAAAFSLLCNYIDNFYRVSKEKYEEKNLVYRELDEQDPNLNFRTSENEEPGTYLVNISRSREDMITKIETLIEDADFLYRKETSELKRIHFDRHLYQPLLLVQRIAVIFTVLSYLQIKLLPPVHNRVSIDFFYTFEYPLF